MTELLTSAQMRAIEQAAIDSGEVTGLELMERAGQGVVDAILEWRPELATAPHRAVVLCGPGNNGGDGFVVARLLHKRGWEVEVFLYGDEAKLPPDAAENAQRWRELGDIVPLKQEVIIEALSAAAPRYSETVVIDAIFGAGLSRPIGEALSNILEPVSWHSEVPVVFVDSPTGICMDSGEPLGDRCLRASDALCVTFHRQRIGHHLSFGPTEIKELRTVDLGLAAPRGNRQMFGSERVARKVAPSRLTEFLARRPSSSCHKYLHGHAVVLSGGPGKGGAARLAARGALRIGAGLVTVGCPSKALTENAARLDAIMLAEIESADALSTELEARKVKALCIGPGFGMGERLRDFIKVVTGASWMHPTRVPVVLDADALTEFREDPETLFGMLHEGCVLTPHEGEFGRLFPDILAKLKAPATKGPAYSKVDATREAAKRAGCVVLFKGADTVIAEPSGRCAINSAHYDRAAPWLATAGSGDVLAGFITGLLARGFAPMEAAETAAWLHVECALKFGPGLIAEDLPEQLPAVFRDLGL